MHTKGPWKLLKFDEDERYEVVTDVSTKRIYRSVATLPFGFSEPAETEQHANAKLIAAAPDLLMALQLLLPGLILDRRYPDDDDDDDIDALNSRIETVTEAIKKATT